MDALYLLLSAVFWLAQYICTPYLTIFLIDRGATAFAAGVIAGAYGCVQIFVRLPIGGIADQLRRPIVLVRAGAGCMLVAAVLMRFGQTMPVYFLSRMIAGISAAAWVVVLSMYLRESRNRAAAQSIGRITAAQYVGILSAFLVAGAVCTAFSVEAIYSADILAAAAWLAVSFLIRSDASALPLAGDRRFSAREYLVLMKSSLKNIQLFRGSLLFSLSQFIVFASSMSFATTFAKQTLGVEGFRISLITLSFSLSTFLASLWVDRGMGRRISQRNAALLSFVLMTLSTVSIVFAKSVAWICATQVLCGLGYGVHCSILNAFALETTPEAERSTAMGYFMGMHCIAITLAPICMGWLIDLCGGYTAPFLSLGGVSVLAAVLTARFYASASRR